MKRVYSIQYLRALAASFVVIFHALESSSTKFAIGAAGVDIFFIISGFIMGTLMQGEEANPRRFAVRRLIRIIPLYWASTVFAIIIYKIKPGIFYQFDPNVKNLFLSLAFVPHINILGRAEPTLIQGWTLEYEMFFYLLCTIILYLPIQRKILYLVILILGLCGIGVLVNPTNPVLAVALSEMLLEFALGLALAAAWHLKILPKSASLGLCLVSLGLCVYVVEEIFGKFEGVSRLIHWGIPAWLIVYGALILEGAGWIARWRPGLLLGDASYSLYLTHGFVIAPILWHFDSMAAVPRAVICWLLAVALGVFVYQTMERPLNRRMMGKLPMTNSAPAMQA